MIYAFRKRYVWKGFWGHSDSFPEDQTGCRLLFDALRLDSHLLSFREAYQTDIHPFGKLALDKPRVLKYNSWQWACCM